MWRRVVFLQLCYLSGTLGGLNQSSSSSPRLSSRKSTTPHLYDPYIICDLEGPSHEEGLPAAYSSQVYAELLTLCSTAHGARQNVGCFCASSEGHVHCDTNLAESALWNAMYNPEDESIIHQFEVVGIPRGTITFPELCQVGCECKDTNEAAEWFEENFGTADHRLLNGVNGLVGSSTRPSGAGAGGASGSGSGRGSGRGSGVTAPGSGTVVSGVQSVNDGYQWQNQCGNNCTFSKDCGVPEGSNSSCTCQAHSSQYQPGPGTVAFIAACLVTLGSGGGGKREEALPCPCNSSYVSHGCCGVLDGLVWESPESNLGILLTG